MSRINIPIDISHFLTFPSVISLIIQKIFMEKISPVEEMKMIHEITGPAISILLPFEPKMSLKHELDHKLKTIAGKIEKELLTNFSAEKAIEVVKKLQHILAHLNFDTHKKSIAIFISPEIEKVYYLDIFIKERIIIDDSFEIRDLIDNKNQSREYLILHLTGKRSKIYLASNKTIQVIKTNVADNIYSYERDMPERVPHFDDPKKHKEILLEKFLHQMDDGLTIIHNAFPLPVFVIGSEKILGHFKKITKNQSAIIEYAHGGHEDLTESEIAKIIEPNIVDWNRIKQVTLSKQIEKANGEHKLASGIKEVLEAAIHKNSRLLVLEKDFSYPIKVAGGEEKEKNESDHFFYINDMVGSVIEKVLEYGGDVEFVDNGQLKDYDHIALIKYY